MHHSGKLFFPLAMFALHLLCFKVTNYAQSRPFYTLGQHALQLQWFLMATMNEWPHTKMVILALFPWLPPNSGPHYTPLKHNNAEKA